MYGPPDRLREVGAQAEHTLNKYQEGLAGADLRGRLEDGEQLSAGTVSAGRLRNVALIWTLVVVAIGAAASWLLDPVMAAWTVVAVTAIVVVARLSRWRKTPPPTT